MLFKILKAFSYGDGHYVPEGQPLPKPATGKSYGYAQIDVPASVWTDWATNGLVEPQIEEDAGQPPVVNEIATNVDEIDTPADPPDDEIPPPAPAPAAGKHKKNTPTGGNS